MRHAIVYSSRTGNTRLLAEHLESLLPGAGYVGGPSPEALAAERIDVGFWTDRGTCDSGTAEFLKTLTDQEVFLFGTAGFGGDPGYFEVILNRVKALLPQGVRVAGGWMCQGKMPQSVRQRYEAMGARKDPVPNLPALLENFDRALTHPDRQDLADFAEAVSRSL